ncbi:MAG: hypothetical protein M3460_28935 [Actinomycetota bacterium]|nr:hypothetical protein [Actinomycetota bacterium]
MTLLDCLLDEGITAQAAHLPGLSLRRCRLVHASEPALYADERLWARITGITLGYGYQPWRALLFLVSVVVTSVVLAITLGAHGALVHPLV